MGGKGSGGKREGSGPKRKLLRKANRRGKIVIEISPVHAIKLLDLQSRYNWIGGDGIVEALIDAAHEQPEN